jgi:hypothetical protein
VDLALAAARYMQALAHLFLLTCWQFTLSGVACKDWHIIAFDKLPVWFDS